MKRIEHLKKDQFPEARGDIINKINELISAHNEAVEPKEVRDVCDCPDPDYECAICGGWMAEGYESYKQYRSAIDRIRQLKEALEKIVSNHFECDAGEACDAHNIAKSALNPTPPKKCFHTKEDWNNWGEQPKNGLCPICKGTTPLDKTCPDEGIKKLREFVDWAMEQCQELGDVDAGEIIDKAEKLGLLELRPIEEEQSIDGEKEHYFTKWTPKEVGTGKVDKNTPRGKIIMALGTELPWLDEDLGKLADKILKAIGE